MRRRLGGVVRAKGVQVAMTALTRGCLGDLLAARVPFTLVRYSSTASPWQLPQASKPTGSRGAPWGSDDAPVWHIVHASSPWTDAR